MKILQITNEDYEYILIKQAVTSEKKMLEVEYTIYKIYCKFRNHCHYAGKYWGALHSISNLKCSIPKKIPVFFHNESSKVS